MGGQFLSLRVPNILHPRRNDLLYTWVPPDVGHDVVIPIATHLSASVEAFKTLESNVQHDVTEREVRQQEPVRIN